MYHIGRVTSDGTPYFVSNSFYRRYGRDRRAVLDVEQRVQEHVFKHLQSKCRRERYRQRKLLHEAAKHLGKDQSMLLQQAHSMTMDGCDKLKELVARS